MKAKRVAAILAATLTLTTAACQTDAQGKVIHKWLVAKPLIFTLVVKQADGSKVKVQVHRSAWRRCRIGDQYPQCTN
jgi:hypothetical protein